MEFFVGLDGFPVACPHCGSERIAWSYLSQPGDMDLSESDMLFGGLGPFEGIYD